ncbi:hypothetical protein [Labedaea rhizosphaerae]|uniref:Uncharacterized protein n=1 Tax=Labedaea rhizosphaerae TaxID=598644 RepID=A0A4R6S5D5_LABRH|nr:hypothetical protein [Labedaea rhizosphaerae]TDP94871.1 hypothetical protein EV186_105103 [Labedaea rhizosphaerae]
MTALSEIANFLLSLMHNGKAREEFNRDPEGAFAKHGLHGVTGQDVRDAHLMMCDDGSVHAKPGHGGGGGGGGGHHEDPVHAVQHIYNNYEVTEVDASSHTSIGEINVLDIDDRDTTVIDSFNSDDDTNVVAVQDNDTTTNVDDHSTNTDVDVTNVEDSFNEGGPTNVHTDHEVVTDPAPDATDHIEDPAPDPAFDDTPVDAPVEAAVEEPPAEHTASIDDHADDFADDGAFDPAAAG